MLKNGILSNETSNFLSWGVFLVCSLWARTCWFGVLSIAFWVRSASSPTLFPYGAGHWPHRNTSLSIII
jgi:hypothetical protein